MAMIAATPLRHSGTHAPEFRPQPGMNIVPRHGAPAPVLHGTILPSLLDEALLELELSLTHFDPRRDDFLPAVREAARTAGGDILFDLPGNGVIDDCQRFAVVHIPSDGATSLALACLEADGETIRVEAPDERTAPILHFAESFVGLLMRF